MTLKSLYVKCCVLLISLVVTCTVFTNGDDNNEVLSHKTSPNIIFFLLDDAGWNDFGYNNASWVLTPYIDNLAINEGIVLTNHYVQSWCLPTRAAFLTGRYPIRYGLQDEGIKNCRPIGLPLSETLIPELLKEYGNYDTYMIGKWHLGYYMQDYLAHERGFDINFGYYGIASRYTFEQKLRFGDFIEFTGIDLRENNKLLYNNDRIWMDYLMGNYTVSDILIDKYINQTYDTFINNNPFFIFSAFSAPHTPLAADEEAVNRYLNYSKSGNDNDLNEEISDIMMENSDRGVLLAMISSVDDIIGAVTNALKSDVNNIWDNTLIIVTTDNGGTEFSTSYPLRGRKFTLYEGGTKVPAFISGGFLNKIQNGSLIGTQNDALIHVSDWFLTFLGLIKNSSVNINTTEIQEKYEMDGFDHSWNLFGNNTNDTITKYGTRDTMLYNMNLNKFADPTCNTYLLGVRVCGAIRWRQWKLVIGNQVYELDSDRSGWLGIGIVPDYGENGELINKFSFNYANCNRSNEPIWNETYFENKCPFNGEACLFNLENDPCEYVDVKDDYPDIYDRLVTLLVDYANGEYGYVDEPSLAIKNLYQYDFPACLPSFNFSDHWIPWLPWTTEYTFVVVLLIMGFVSSLYLCALCCHPTCIDIVLAIFVVVVTVSIVDDWHVEIDVRDDVSEVFFKIGGN